MSLNCRRPLAVVIGCGGVGGLAAAKLVADGWHVIGIRRQPGAAAVPWRWHAGDAHDPQLHLTIVRRWGPIDAVLIAMPPGLRRGGDNHLDHVVWQCHRWYPTARVVLISTTGVYADAGGRRISEHGELGRSHRAQRLVAIEHAARAHPGGACVLRATAITSAGRAWSSPRANAGVPTVQTPVARAFNYVHEADLAAIASRAMLGMLDQGVWNVAAPETITLVSYWRRVAALRGHPIALKPSARLSTPERVIDASALTQALPPLWTWRPALAD